MLIDSWGTMWRIARELKLRGTRARRIKLIGPQVWATRPGRARVLAQWCDHLLCIHAFEQPFYRKWGLPTTVIGNPALGRLPHGDGAAFRRMNGIGAEKKVIGLLPGFRIDNAAHIGGLVAGLAVGYAAGTQPLYERWTEKLWKLAAALCIAITLAAFAMMFLFLLAVQSRLQAS